jgi:hypothetical protein
MDGEFYSDNGYHMIGFVMSIATVVGISMVYWQDNVNVKHCSL